MILESLNQVKDGNNYKSIHVIILEPNQKIVMGRGHEADVRINDISVSRMHGTITLDAGNSILLRDLGSKFGTLALIQQNFVCLNKKVCLQIGRSYMEVKCYPMSDFILAQQEQKELEKANQNKELRKNLHKHHSHNPQHKELINPSLDNFDLHGIREVIDGTELSQMDIYNMIQRKNQIQGELLSNPMASYNQNSGMNIPGKMQMNLGGQFYQNNSKQSSSKPNGEVFNQDAFSINNNIDGNLANQMINQNNFNMMNMNNYGLNSVLNPIPHSSNSQNTENQQFMGNGNGSSSQVNGNKSNSQHQNGQNLKDKKASNSNINQNGNGNDSKKK